MLRRTKVWMVSRVVSRLAHFCSSQLERADDLGLPPRTVIVRKDYFSPEEKELYLSLFSDAKRKFSTYVDGGTLLNSQLLFLISLILFADETFRLLQHLQLVSWPFVRTVLYKNMVLTIYRLTRMRQMACHPDLVLKSKTNAGRFTTEDQQEATVCRLCNDIAEDAIRSQCRHIFDRECIRQYLEAALDNSVSTSGAALLQLN